MNKYRCYYKRYGMRFVEASTEIEAKRKAKKLFKPLAGNKKIESWQITCVIDKKNNNVDSDVNKPLKMRYDGIV